MYKLDGSEEETEGLTVLIDGVVKQVFDQIKEGQDYDNYHEVLRDVIFEGVNTFIRKEN